MCSLPDRLELRWEINGISEQDALIKFTVDIWIRVRVLISKKKTWGMQGNYIFFIFGASNGSDEVHHI